LPDQVDLHLNTVARSLGRFLRGFDDPRVHNGSPELFQREFRKVMAIPGLRVPGQAKAISYAEAAASGHRPPGPASAKAPDSPVSVLVLGLTIPATSSRGAGLELPLEPLGHDLAALLRAPVLLFYLQVSDRDRFLRELAAIARRDGFPLLPAATDPAAGPPPCPACGSALPPDHPGRSLQCGTCGIRLERARPLPLVPGVTATVSFEMLRRLVALDLVTQYQEEGTIIPLQPGSPMS